MFCLDFVETHGSMCAFRIIVSGPAQGRQEDSARRLVGAPAWDACAAGAAMCGHDGLGCMPEKPTHNSFIGASARPKSPHGRALPFLHARKLNRADWIGPLVWRGLFERGSLGGVEEGTRGPATWQNRCNPLLAPFPTFFGGARARPKWSELTGLTLCSGWTHVQPI